MQLSTFPLTSVVATTLLAAVFAAAAAVPPSTTSTYANFSQSCTAVGLSHSFFLGATCCYPELVGTGEGEDHGGGVVEAQSLNELDLTMCIGLDQGSGRMKWEVYGKFSNYCTNCTVAEADGEGAGANHLLTCACSPLIGKRVVVSTLDLDAGISNEMGTLRCAGGMASLSAAHGRV